MAHWTPANMRLLEKLWEQGKTGGEISAALKGKFSRSAVIAKSSRMGLSRRPSPLPNRDLS